MLKLYNTLTRKKQVFKPLSGKKVGLYTCGPTVYNYDHLGHAWNYTMADVLRRVFEYNGYKVKHVMNITDVGHLESDSDTGEDKIEKSAQEKKKTVWEIAEYYTKIYLINRKKLNLLEPTVICKATSHIKEMISLIKKLIQKKYAYKIDDGIYFEVKKFKKYGQLSGNTLKKLKAGARIEINPQKRHPADFALWKLTPKEVKRQMEWNSPWGRGFPGWHIECSAMSMKYLGKTIDIHTGGEDNIFPHHESEIAQSEAANGKKFVRFWFHPRFLMVEGKKMSKSLKNFYTLSDIEKKGFSPLALRYLFLTANYHSPLNFTWKSLEAAQNALNSLTNNLQQTKNEKSQITNYELIKKYENKFLSAVNDDFNTPKAIAIVWEIIKDKNLSQKSKKQLLLKFDKVLGLGLNKVETQKNPVIPEKIRQSAARREKLRVNKQFIQADVLRKKIEKLGYSVEDTAFGPKVRKKL
jgi:cysteinyl-tRNA synthetase